MADPTIVLDIEPDWSDAPSLAFSFLTAIQDTPYFVEQRRSLLPTAVRMLGCKFTESDAPLQRLRNTLLAAKSSLVCVPIFTEPIVTASIVTGGSSITASTSLTYLWNIQNCSYVVLLDTVTGQSEMLGVASVSGQLIRFTTNIVETWVAAQTVIYPAMAAVLKGLKEDNILNKTASIAAEFEETTIGSEATEEWVGLDELVCTGRPTLFLDWIDRSYGGFIEYVDVSGYGEVLKLHAVNRSYVGDYGCNAEGNTVFTRAGALVVEFDYFHGTDVWYDDDFTDTQFWFGIYPNVSLTIPQDYWQYGIPSPSTGIKLYMRKLSTARVTLATSNLGTLANPSLSGLSSGLYASNHYKMTINWNTHTISVWVNDILVIDEVSFGTGLDASLGSTCKFLFHWHYYVSGPELRYIKDFRITR